MPALFFTCPNTNQRAPTGVLTDVQSLRASWSKTLKVECSFCGQVHSFEVHELYADNAMWNAADAPGGLFMKLVVCCRRIADNADAAADLAFGGQLPLPESCNSHVKVEGV
jgi:hypothetical protein